MGLRFSTDNIQLRASGRGSRGVKSMRLRQGDVIVDMDVIRAVPNSNVVTAGHEAHSEHTASTGVSKGGSASVRVESRVAKKPVVNWREKSAPPRGTEGKLLLAVTQGGQGKLLRSEDFTIMYTACTRCRSHE